MTAPRSFTIALSHRKLLHSRIPAFYPKHLECDKATIIACQAGIRSAFLLLMYSLLLVLVLVVDERGSFSAIDAHIFPCLVQTVLEDVD